MITVANEAEYDVVIIGAGAAGMSLLLALADLNYSGSVKLLEKNADLINDRTWSFWHNNTIAHYIQKITAHEWQSWSLSVDSTHYVMSHPIYKYACVRAEAFNTLGLKTILQGPKLDIEFDCAVESISFTQQHVAITTNQGLLRAKKVVDTRPPALHHQHRGLFQCFYGEEITTDIDFFDPTTVKLMDQLTHSTLGLEFIYILPFSANRALVEFTCFSANIVNTTILKARLAAVLKHTFGQLTYSVQRVECAVLPMYHVNNNKTSLQHANLVYGGIAGGAMRASTGYSFLSSQRWAASCAHALVHKQSLSAYTPVKMIYRKMDALMLNILRGKPQIGSIIFKQMFTKISAERFVRFMTENATIVDFIAVVWAMPKRVFIKALFTRSAQANGEDIKGEVKHD